ncbi:hypothetical protein ACF3MZ_26395 [Paenibacillaceae bacterium WGS1546]|uniref:hypothetical protein n=1 Tax=Cohnella sp. WGS1546 TaxID=3366810 RepID=UPI00372D1A12
MQLLGDRLLDHPIYYGRNAQLSHAASIWFLDFLPPYRAWLIASISDPLQELVSVFPQPWQRRLDGHPVDSRRSVIALDLLVGSVQVVPVQYSLQQVVCTVSFFTFPSSGAPRSRIPFMFHTISLQAALSVSAFITPTLRM